VTATKLGSGT